MRRIGSPWIFGKRLFPDFTEWALKEIGDWKEGFLQVRWVSR
jgi:hypothetical protein